MTRRRCVLCVSVALAAATTSACATISFSWGATPTPAAARPAPRGVRAAPSVPTGMTALQYQAAAESISLTAGDLSPLSVHSPVAAVPGAAASGWTVITDQAINVDEITPGCLPELYPEIAAWDRAYSYDLQPNDAEEGHGTLRVYVIDTAAHAAAEQAAVVTASYGTCYAAQVPDDLSGTGAVATGPVTMVVESVDAGVSSYTRLYTLPYTFAGEAKTNYDSVVWLQSGRYRAILDLWTCCGQPPASDFQADTQLLGARMQAAPA